MTLLAPLAAALALTLPAIVALYFLRIRRQTRVVPDLHLWPDQILDRQANVPWQRLRFSWLLLLQLLAVAVLVAAAVQPALSAGTSLARHSVVLLDVSASMQAHDVQPSRLDEAKRQVAAVIDQLGPQDRMTLIGVSSAPRILASVVGDRDSLHRALTDVAATNGAADLSSALRLAAGLVRPGDDARAYLFSDGIVGPLRTDSSNSLPFPVEYHPIGVSGENVGLTSLVVRTGAQSRAGYLHVQNFGQQSRSFSLDWRADGQLLDVRQLTLAGGQAADLVLPVPAGATLVSAHLDAGDVFALDDTVTAVARTPRVFRVLLVTPGNVFLQQAIGVRADVQLDVIAPAAYKSSTAYAMSIFDRYSPPALPDGPFIMIDPPAGSPLAGGTGIGIGRVRASDAGDPLLTNVDLQDVHVARSQDLRLSQFGRALITSPQTPLLVVRDEPFRQVLFGFDIHESDLPLRIAFPILVQNLSEWMLPPSVPSHSFHPDEPVTIVPEPGAASVTVVRPDGGRRSLATSSISTFADTDLTGLYTVEQAVSGKVDRSWFTVNLFSDQISQLKPASRLTLPPIGNTTTVHSAHHGLLEIWPWIALVALVIVVLEWLAFHRGL
ncbi:MAG TPA: VWA domain-containing protein [Candidatus Dormibacteraeota bacterium]|nr:VWA domain-containing protein [Candidatus Dormibacteraeota bacterium]